MKNLIKIILISFTRVAWGRDCSGYACSLSHEPVCALTGRAALVPRVTLHSFSSFHNECHFLKHRCQVSSYTTETKLVPAQLCNLPAQDGRRYGYGTGVRDQTIVGSYRHCNHSCPTYCVDTYEPVCAIIRYMDGETERTAQKTMINHCHVDLLSCSLGVNVTTTTISRCYKNARSLLFATQVAVMKSLRLLRNDDRIELDGVSRVGHVGQRH